MPPPGNQLAYNPRLLEADRASSIVCRGCTEGQVTELECIECGLVKSLEGFTKAQRRDPDKAPQRCYKCVNAVAEAHVAGDDAAELRPYDDSDEDDEDDDAEDMDHGSIAETNAHASSFASASDDEESQHIDHHFRDLALNEPQRTGRSASGTMNDWAGSANDHPAVNAWKEMAAQEDRGGSAGTSRNREKAPTVFTGYDPSGKAHEHIRSPSTVASDDSPPRSTSHVTPRSNFARIKGGKVFNKPGMQVPDAAESALGRQREDYDSGSDSDFGKI
ncbi:MAG: hypothetical protein Q9191_007746 [Dirinaria sp. TL-2023a]